MDELDTYVAKILGVDIGDLAASAPIPLDTRAPSASPVRRRRLAQVAALAASVVFAVVVVASLQVVGPGRLHRSDPASSQPRAAVFLDVPREAKSVAEEPFSLPGAAARAAPSDRLTRAAAQGDEASSLARAATGSVRRPARTVQMARVAPRHARRGSRLETPARAPVDMAAASAATPIRVMDTAAQDRLDAVDAIRLLRQR